MNVNLYPVYKINQNYKSIKKRIVSRKKRNFLAIGLLVTITLSGITPGQKLVQASRLGNIANAQEVLKTQPEIGRAHV